MKLVLAGLVCAVLWHGLPSNPATEWVASALFFTAIILTTAGALL